MSKIASKYIPKTQLSFMLDCVARKSGDADYFRDKLNGFDSIVEAMPETYEADGQGDDAIVHLHYFSGGLDCFIIEKDKLGSTKQAFGFVDSSDGMPELRYISIEELIEIPHVNVDLMWKARTLGEVREEQRVSHAHSGPF
jgi:hypothetical protein